MTKYQVLETLIISLVEDVEAESPEEALEKTSIPYNVKNAIEEGYLDHPVGPRLTTRVYEFKDGLEIEVLEVYN